MKKSDGGSSREATEAVLRAVDGALTIGRATSRDAEQRELQEIALALRADAPLPGPEFEAALDARRAEGFPRTGAASRPRLGSRTSRPRRGVRALLGKRPMLAPLGGLASVLLVVIVASSLIGGDLGTGGRDESGGGAGVTEDASPGRDDMPQAAGRAGRDSESAPAARSLVAPEPPFPGDRGVAPGERNRRIERSASLTLAAPNDRLDAVAEAITAVVDRRRGFVLRSSLTTGDEGTTGGSFELRVPARELRATLRELSGLATVRSRSQAGEDITRAFRSTEDRLAAARAERRGLLRRLEGAQTDQEARAIRDRLGLVSGEIRGLLGQMRNLRERTAYAAVTVSLVEKEDDEGAGGGGTGAALDDALDSLVGSFNLALRALGVLIPLGLVAGLVWLVGASVRRRRREAVLS